MANQEAEFQSRTDLRPALGPENPVGLHSLDLIDPENSLGSLTGDRSCPQAAAP